MMDAAKAVQAAVVQVDLIICRARDSPAGAVMAALAAAVILYQVIRRCRK